MDLDNDEREEAEALALDAGLLRRCASPACDNVIATGEEVEDEDLFDLLRSQGLEDDDLETMSKAIRTVVDGAPEECGCALGS